MLSNEDCTKNHHFNQLICSVDKLLSKNKNNFVNFFFGNDDTKTICHLSFYDCRKTKNPTNHKHNMTKHFHLNFVA